MEKSGEQAQAARKGEDHHQGTGKTEEVGLPVESSPYTQYKDLEDYKMQGYGAEGHQQPQTGRGAGGTDAPTPSGATAAPQNPQSSTTTDTINRQGVP